MLYNSLTKIVVTFLFFANALLAIEFPALHQRLREMYQEDQDSCWRWIEAEEALKQQYAIEMENVRKRHNPELREIIKNYSWPGFDKVGADGSEAAWLLIQHQDEDLALQKECLMLLKNAVDAGQADAKHFAYLLDRTNMNSAVAQIYGTQWVGEKGNIALYPIEDIATVDERRKEIGLPSLAEYKERIKVTYHLSDEDFQK